MPIEVAAYYFPGWHADPRISALHGDGWTEWELLRRAEPRFPGHRQPIEPAWGEFDESDPKLAAQQIDLAADQGVTSFLFDWYWYGGSFLEGALDRGFLQAPNRDRLRFALMWANHDWINLQPAPLAGSGARVFDGAVSPAVFEELTEVVIERYFSQPNYLTMGGEPYFSIYELGTFIAGMGGLESARDALDGFRRRARRAGLPGVHLNGVVWGMSVLPSEVALLEPARVAEDLGFSSVTSYVWIHHFDVEAAPFPAASYDSAFEQNRAAWSRYRQDYALPYHPNVTVGWDSSPRTIQSDRFEQRDYPWLPVLVDNTPEAFEAALEAAKAFVSALPEEQRMITINAWNEWTEGSYLLPDRARGAAHLEALGRVFGKTPSVARR